jgi:hypothetical protein
MNEVRNFIAQCVVNPELSSKAGSDLNSAISDYCQMPGCTLSEESKSHLATMFPSIAGDVTALSTKVNGMLSPDLSPTQMELDQRETPGYVGVGR